MKWFSAVAILCVVCSAIQGDSLLSSILTQEDYDLEARLEEEGRPALSSPLTEKEQWESYDEWKCFPNRNVELGCVDIDYGGWRKSPTIFATANDRRYEYSLNPTFKWDCEFTLDEWRRIIGDSSEVCFFGAHLQGLDDDASLWVLSQLKSGGRYWKEYESEAYRRARRKGEETESGE